MAHPLTKITGYFSTNNESVSFENKELDVSVSFGLRDSGFAISINGREKLKRNLTVILTSKEQVRRFLIMAGRPVLKKGEHHKLGYGISLSYMGGKKGEYFDTKNPKNYYNKTLDVIEYEKDSDSLYKRIIPILRLCNEVDITSALLEAGMMNFM